MLAAGCAAGGVPALVLGPSRTGRDFAFADAPAMTFAPVEIADRPRVLHDVRALARLRRLLRSAAPDVVHAHGLRAGALTALALLAMRRRPPLVVTVHNAPPGGGAAGAIYRALELIVARSADSVLCVSADLEARMRAAGARRTGHAVVPAPGALHARGDPPPEPPGSDANTTGNGVRAGLGGPDGGGPIVLGVGRLAAQKGFGVLLEAVAFLRDLRPEPRLMIAGDGPLYDELRAQAASLGVAAEFTGHRTDIPELLAAASVFVLPSLWEGQALILQQALRAGAPIVATRTGGNPALTGHDATESGDAAALLVPPGDPPRLAAAIRAILTDPALADRLRKAARTRAVTLPDESTAVSAALSEYRRVAAGHEDSAER
jgi:glycosyltransferase involved in cell wall biosynthesis